MRLQPTTTFVIVVLAMLIVETARAQPSSPPTSSAAQQGPQQRLSFRSWLTRAFNYNSEMQCSYTDSATGATFDLTNMRKQAPNDFEGSDNTYKYHLNICGNANSGAACSIKRGAICQYSKLTSNFIASLGSWTSYPVPTYSLIDANDPNKGIQITFRNGDSCWINYARVTRVANVILMCGEEDDNSYTVTEEFTTCTFNIRMRNKLACPVGLGSGWLGAKLLLFLFAVLVLGLGVAYWYTDSARIAEIKEQVTWENLTSFEFWKGVPVHAKNGVVWCYEHVVGLVRGKDAEYSKVATEEETITANGGSKMKDKDAPKGFDDL